MNGTVTSQSDNFPFSELVPAVKCYARDEGHFLFRAGGNWFSNASLACRERFSDLAAASCGSWKPVEERSAANLRMELVPGVAGPQGYCLRVARREVEIRAGDDAGLFYGALTFFQLVELCGGAPPCCRIEDEPDFPVRGVMLDISRDKVPAMQTLVALADKLARLKINHLQLYMEHSFAYRGHEEVWKNATPLTAEEVRQLDACCAARFIELVPNQNSFGHMERWLRLPQYNHLAALPEGGAPLPWGGVQAYPSALNPQDPRCLELLEELYAQLLPHFSSRLFNIGCDEVFGLSIGRCAAEALRVGEGRVYLDFLKKIFGVVRKRGRRPAFWGDIIIRHPELVKEIDGDALALEWGYEADHPFDEHGALFAASGLDFFVCPGTSSWNSIAGRHANMKGNIRNAAVNGRKHGAAGLVLTDWGDCGHWQPLCASYPAFAFGAALGWGVEANREMDPAPAAARFFIGCGRETGDMLVELASLYEHCGAFCSNSSVLFHLLFKKDYRVPEGVSVESLADVERRLEPIGERLACTAPCGSCEEETVRREISQMIRLLRAACFRGKALINGELHSKRFRSEWATIAHECVDAQREVWLRRNRQGGLEESLRRPEALR